MPAPLKVDRAVFADLAGQGWTNQALAERFGVTENTVTRLRKATGTVTAPRMTPERRARIEAMLDEGMSFKEIQRTEGADMSTLRKHFPGRNWTPQESSAYTAALRELEPRIRAMNPHAGLKRYTTPGRAAA